MTTVPTGPDFCRYRMWGSWRASTEAILGTYEPEVIQVLRREVSSGSVCFDIGAYVGYYAILLARLTGIRGKVVAFEPILHNFEMLQKNVSLNALANVNPEPLAVSDHEGVLRLLVSAGLVGATTASTTGFAVEGQREAIDVRTCSLDGYVARTGRVPDLLLIDVEEAEMDVLRGAQATLRSARPDLLIEIHGWHGPDRDEVSAFLSKFDYRGTIIGYRNRVAFGFFRSLHRAAGAVARA